MTPRIVAHRGLHAVAGENTAAAFRAALDAGVDTELDVRLCRDGTPVLTHDGVRWHRNRPYPVRWMSRAVLDFLDPLDAALELLAGDGGGARLVLDVKAGRELAAVAAWCRRRDADVGRIALWCRSPATLRELPGRAEFAETALLSGDTDATRYLRRATSCAADAVSLHPDGLGAEAVRRARAAGLAVYAWIREPSAHRAAVDLGVDGLVTDWIDEARQAVTGAA